MKKKSLFGSVYVSHNNVEPGMWLKWYKDQTERLSSLSRTRISTKSVYIEKGNFATRIYPFNFLSNFRKVVVCLWFVCCAQLGFRKVYIISFHFMSFTFILWLLSYIALAMCADLCNCKCLYYLYSQPNCHKHYWIITALKRSLRRSCFYTCLSVILFTVGVSRPTHRGEVGGFGWGVSRPTPGGGGWGVWLGGSPGPHPGGVSRPTPRGSPGPHLGLSLQVQAQGVCLSACCDPSPPPSAHSYCCMRYASYWNAFLFYRVFHNTHRIRWMQ